MKQILQADCDVFIVNINIPNKFDRSIHVMVNSCEGEVAIGVWRGVAEHAGFAGE